MDSFLSLCSLYLLACVQQSDINVSCVLDKVHIGSSERLDSETMDSDVQPNSDGTEHRATNCREAELLASQESDMNVSNDDQASDDQAAQLLASSQKSNVSISSELDEVHIASNSGAQRNSAGNLFTDDQAAAIREHKGYYLAFIEYLDSVEQGKAASEPPKPKRKLDFLKPKMAKSDMTAKELSAFLKQHEINDMHGVVNCFTDEENDTFMKFESFEQTQEVLKTSCATVKQQSTHMLYNSLMFGRWLHRAHILHKSKKREQNWSQFLKKELQISYSYANKLTECANCTSGCRKFFYLSMSIETMYKHRKLITKYLHENETFRKYWSS